jgi:plastocyanin
MTSTVRRLSNSCVPSMIFRNRRIQCAQQGARRGWRINVINRRSKTTLSALALLACLSLASANAPSTQPAPRGGATITGKVTAASEVPLSEMVVFLERATDAPLSEPSTADVPPPAIVRQKGAKFDPPLLVVSVGQAVSFLNDEDKPVEHNVFSNAPAKKFDLGLYPPSQSKSITFDKPGAVFIYCSIHRFMDGVVYVCPTRFHSRVGEDGSYRIENVPPGMYRLKTWQRRKRFSEKSEPLEVKDATPQAVNLELKRP